MSQIQVGIGDYAVSANPTEELKTYALGSCVAVLIYDKLQKVAAMMHIALPDSEVNPGKAQQMPGYFADTGIPRLLSKMKSHNAKRHSIWIKLIGGSNIMDENRRFDIGKRNVLAIKKLLWKYQLDTVAEDIGGGISRTVSISVESGEVLISSGPKKWTL